MQIFRQLPDLRDTPANREFLQLFNSTWGTDNYVVSGRTRRAEFPPYIQPLSIKASWGGSVKVHVDGRTVAVDDDNYLILNDRRTYGSTLHGFVPVRTLSIFFRPGMAEHYLWSLLTPIDGILEAAGEPGAISVEFPEQLRPHDGVVTPLLRYIALHVDRGHDDETWYEEQFGVLLERMLRARQRVLAAPDRLDVVRPAVRREILHRIGLSVDYIQTNYALPLDIDDLAGWASISRFHFMRLFRAVHGVTPFAYLQWKRATVAQRLLRSTDLSRDQVAKRVGFENRTTMLRQLRKLGRILT